ncbi:hypothetical protein EPI10_020654 [Gossypium australe]|uniref:Reverse transcriptase zinc-binding domain-containing protein n=1 Tax=Gossypium australe TaxID=47621 RepID=A0A5B6WFT6_9ROSI|nr:hypothetical protein EPI10_020654 [Gossypium australe]
MTTINTPFYIALWPLQLPRKIKIIMWKIYNDFLTTYVDLSKKNVQVFTVCPLCQDDYRKWLAKTFHSANKSSRKLLTLAFWAIWFVRNRLIHEGVRQTVSEISRSILGYMHGINALATIRNPISPSQ